MVSCDRADFGLGDATGPVDVTVTWPDGEATSLTSVALDQQLRVDRPLP